MLRSGQLQSHIKSVLVPTYRRRYYILTTAIKELLVPLGVTIEVDVFKKDPAATAGGFFTYLRLPKDLPSSRTIAAYALRKHLLRIAFGYMFAVTGDEGSTARAEAPGGFAECIRLCWAWHEEAELLEGIQRLARTILDIRAKIKAGEDLGSLGAIGIR